LFTSAKLVGFSIYHNR